MKKLCLALGITQAELAAKTEFSPAYVSQLVGGSRDVTVKFAHAVCRVFAEVNMDYLLNASDVMFVGVPPPQGVSEPLPRYGDDCAGLRAENEQLRADNARLSRSVATLVDMLAACREKNH